MYQPASIDLNILCAVAKRPHHHFELAPILRPKLSRLWTSHFIRLRQGDIWQITEKGRALLECGGQIH